MQNPSAAAPLGTAGSQQQRQRAVIWFSAITIAVLAIVTFVAALARPLGASQPVTGISLFVLMGFAALVAILVLAWSYTIWANRRDRLDRAAGVSVQ